MERRRIVFLRRVPRAEAAYLADALRQESVGGAILLVAAATALIWSNSPWHGAYEAVRGLMIGPSALHLDLSLEQWTADGLLAIFFFVAGLELKRELVVGELRKLSEASVPVAAAVGGMAVPVVIYLTATGGRNGTAEGWAIPMATDIAFALAVLGVIGTALPAALRAFLLTLAVVDDLGAVTVIALFYSSVIHPLPLAMAFAGLVLWRYLQYRRVHKWWVYIPLAAIVWALFHESGVHATVAGVVLALLVRVRPDPGEEGSPAEHLEHVVRPVSAGFAVPLFALFAAGVRINWGNLSDVGNDIIVPGIVLGLVIGKTIGVFAGAYLTARFTRAELSGGLAWHDVLAVAALSGIGFTVALLVGDLAFGVHTARSDHATIAVLLGSVLAALAASMLLLRRNRVYRKLAEEEPVAAEA